MFRDQRWRPVWLLLRLWLGYQWLEAGLHKVADPKWMVTGEAIRGYWMRAAGLLPGAKPAIKYGWYETFIRWLAESGQQVWFAKLVALGELLVGVGLIVGGLTLVAAFFGALMNLNYMLAGTASTNPVMYTAAILIIIAGPAAYYWGVDRFLLPYLKTALARVLARTRGVPAERTT
ncbi:MAG: DoxX family membrane protein [Bacillota bacterium]|nr:DoxX family membrane protein [Bacillota bacterium]